jgi:hypothetical protein
MNDSMKKPPMQKDAERLAAQGRFGDTMLVHMTPKEVKGLASLIPGGKLTTNPVTGQPEAFIMEALALATAAKGAYDAFKKPKTSTQQKSRGRTQSALDQYTQTVLGDVGQSGAFKPPQTLDEAIASGKTSFLPQGVGGFDNRAFAYQRLPGMTYANLPGTTTPFYPQANMPTAPVTSAPPPTTGTTAPVYRSMPVTEPDLINDTDATRRENELLLAELIGDENERRFEEAGNELANIREFERTLAFEKALREGPFKLPDYEDLIDEENLMITMANGGIAALAQGGDVDFPRMNGPISGPGTETSDDIPAMLSDGEFVVNAKAVRGVGKLNGAGKSKEEQRREGARMMYALQRAGEQAMRKA